MLKIRTKRRVALADSVLVPRLSSLKRGVQAVRGGPDFRLRLKLKE